MKKGKHPAPTASVAPRPTQEPKVQLGVGKKIVFAVCAVLLVVAVLEAGLALVGVKPELYEKDPYVGFASQSPLFVEEIGPDGKASMVTAKNRLAFFNRQQFPKEKDAGVCRIFSMGESTTYGHPYDDATSFNGWLREFLRATAPDRVWEVINAGGISYGSYRVARLMEELIQYKPDLFVVYLGHNEFLERRIYNQMPRLPRAMNGLTRLAWRSRAATTVKRALSVLSPSDRATSLAPQLEGEPVTLLDNTLGPTAYTREKLFKEETFRHYEFNLGRIVDIAESAGARVIFVTPASNLREASPFKSEARPGLSDDERRRWLELYEQARQDFTNPSPTNALASLAEAEAIDSLPANLHYVRGRVLEKLGRYAEAKTAYERARDEDVCPLRAPTEIRKILTRVTSERRVPLIDFEAIVAAASEHGIPGGAMFLDHVHPTVEGYRLLALEILKTMEKQGLVRPTWDTNLIQSTTHEVLGRIDAKAHSLALMNLCKTLGWAGKREEAYRAGTRAVQLSPNIAEVRYQAGLAAQLNHRLEEAMAHYQRAIELQPSHSDAHCSLGVVLEDQGRFAEAIEHYRAALRYEKPKDHERNQRNLASAMAKFQSSPPPQ